MIRILDILFSIFGILLLSPFFLLIAIIIKINSNGPVLFRQLRVGLNGREFYIYKFRSMKTNSDKLRLITVGIRDERVTSAGYYLRKYKLDELPQLFNVLKGEMSFVGPRPEVKKYVDLYTLDQRRVLSVRPGITDWASIYYREENAILEGSINPEKEYIEKIVPDKIRYNLMFIENYTTTEYLKILIHTIRYVFVST